MKQLNEKVLDNLLKSEKWDKELDWCVFCDAKDRCDTCDATDGGNSDCGDCDFGTECTRLG